MFTQRIFSRYLHMTRSVLAGEKSNLAALRKKTGYTFANCKKALEMNNNDMEKAEKWLNDQAQSMGWSKATATKLEGRTTAQGLVGVLVKNNIASMVEINCETDFVARNEHFRNFVDHVSKVCTKYTETTEFDGDLWKLGFEGEALKNLKAEDENASLRRAICFKTNNYMKLYGYAHPSPVNEMREGITHVGKFGTIVAFNGEGSIPLDLQRNLCQHIVGMNPKKIGEAGKDKPVENKDDETTLIFQEYLVDNEKTVEEVLKENNVSIVDYQRYECGEKVKSDLLNEEVN
uniref:Elongation factor Ts, mitochondrial n=1 Tax=Megaselia scalaris TaxID=36166 RepID=T1GPU6_MEGSC